MKQVIQLPIPFDDLEPITRPEPSQVPAAHVSECLYSIELRAYGSVAALLRRSMSFLITCFQAALIVSFGFALMFLAAIIGG